MTRAEIARQRMLTETDGESSLLVRLELVIDVDSSKTVN